MTSWRPVINRLNDVHDRSRSRSLRRGAKWSPMLWLMAVVFAARSYGAEDEPDRSKADARAGQRMKIMSEAIDALQLTSAEIKSESALRFAERPILRYQDQSRQTGDGVKGVLDASVWRLGKTGRPTALVTLEIYPVVNQSMHLLAYEFISLSPQKFEMKNASGPRWMPHGTDLSMAALDDAPEPAETPRGRLSQMRELARRFAVQEELSQGQKIVCRLLPQPINRYDDAAAGITDGAIFVFANGTNPEVGLLLECSDKDWSYGAFRLTAAKIFAELDGKLFLEATWNPGEAIKGSYSGVREWVALPK
jgi:hypothetical protein